MLCISLFADNVIIMFIHLQKKLENELYISNKKF